MRVLAVWGRVSTRSTGCLESVLPQVGCRWVTRGCSHAAVVNNALLKLRQRCRLGDSAGGPGERDGVDAAELASDAPPRYAGAPLSDPDQQECEPAQQDVWECQPGLAPLRSGGIRWSLQRSIR